MAKERNFDGIQYESIRRKVDIRFNVAHDLLTEIYYKEWKIGNLNRAFQGHKPATIAEAKSLFDKLHGLIFHLHELALDERNDLDGNPYPELKESMDRIRETETKTRREKIQDKIAERKAEGLEIEVIE